MSGPGENVMETCPRCKIVKLENAKRFNGTVARKVNQASDLWSRFGAHLGFDCNQLKAASTFQFPYFQFPSCKILWFQTFRLSCRCGRYGCKSCKSWCFFGDSLRQILNHVFTCFECVVQKFQRFCVSCSSRSILNIQDDDLRPASNVMRHCQFKT